MLARVPVLCVLALAGTACISVHPGDGDVYEGLDSAPPIPTGEGRVLLLVSSRLPRPAEVIAILDMHWSHDDYDRALGELALEAESLGADAVVGVEFHHAGRDGQHHLSGLAVRMLR